MKDEDLKIFAGKGKVLRQLARDPEWSKKLDQAKTDAEVMFLENSAKPRDTVSKKRKSRYSHETRSLVPKGDRRSRSRRP